MLAGLFAVIVLLQALIVVIAVLAFYHVIKQQGRMLNRIDTIEDRLNFVYRSVARLEKQMDADNPSLPPSMPTDLSGLTVGTEIAPFALPDLDGTLRGWDSFRGQKLLFMHWNPGCGFCDLLAPDLARIQNLLKAQNVHLLLLSYGDALSNRQLLEEHGLNATVLLMQEDAAPLSAFEGQGTPVAYLVEEQGRVASPLARGAHPILTLTKEVIQAGGAQPLPLLEPEPTAVVREPEPQALKAGTRAPIFTLTDVEGNSVSLDSYRGKSVLLVFSDPDCSSCETLAPELERIHQAHRNNGRQVLMVGRGDPNVNRAKIAQQGLTFPVLLQRRWEVARKYGTLATPAAFLLNEEGILLRDVAIGVDAILALASERVAVSAG